MFLRSFLMAIRKKLAFISTLEAILSLSQEKKDPRDSTFCEELGKVRRTSRIIEKIFVVTSQRKSCESSWVEITPNRLEACAQLTVATITMLNIIILAEFREWLGPAIFQNCWSPHAFLRAILKKYSWTFSIGSSRRDILDICCWRVKWPTKGRI